MALTTLTLNELYEEISDLARDQGAADRVAWNELVGDVMEAHMAVGEIDLDEDTEGMKEELSAKWFQFKKEMAEEKDSDEAEIEEDTVVNDIDDEESDKKDKDALDMGDGD